MTKKKQPTLPKSIRIGYKDYRVEQVKSFSGTSQMGQHSITDGLIQWRDCGDPTENINTILHESLHGMFNTSGLSEGMEQGEEERIVNALANSMTAYLRDNKPLIEWMITNAKA